MFGKLGRGKAVSFKMKQNEMSPSKMKQNPGSFPAKMFGWMDTNQSRSAQTHTYTRIYFDYVGTKVLRIYVCISARAYAISGFVWFIATPGLSNKLWAEPAEALGQCKRD